MEVTISMANEPFDRKRALRVKTRNLKRRENSISSNF